MAVRILLADDCRGWRVAVRSIVERLPHVRVIGEATDGMEAVEKAARLLPDVVVLDVGMPILNGIEAARRIRGSCPESRIIFLTQEHDPDVRREALDAGAAEYLLKAEAFEVRATLDRVMRERRQIQQPESPLRERLTLFLGR